MEKSRHFEVLGSWRLFKILKFFFAVTESINWKYDLSQETIDIAMDLTRKCTYHHADVNVALCDT